MTASPSWHDSPSFRRIAEAFGDAADDPVAATLRAVDLLSDDQWAATLLDPLVASLAADPMYQPPLASTIRHGRAVIMLFDTPAIRLSVSLVAKRPHTDIARTVMLGNLTVTRFVVAGSARVRRWQAAALTDDFDALGAAPAREVAPLALHDGAVVVQPAIEGQLLSSCTSDIVRIAVSIRHGAAPLTREYATADGSFLRAASNDEGASRSAMLLTLLRLQRRTEAASVFEAATRDPAFHARWSAMREWLALDARAAAPRLQDMATNDPNREVRAAAAATFAKLMPRLEVSICPA